MQVLDNSPRDGKIVDAMASFSRGFVTAGEGGLVRVYEYTDTEDTSKFACVKTLRATGVLMRICTSWGVLLEWVMVYAC